jgi:hypothetical protein
MSPGGAQHFAGAVVLGVLDGDAVTGLDEHARHKVERLLRAVDNDHFSGIADHAARAPQVGADGGAQVEAADCGTVIERAHRGHADLAQQDAPPDCEGEGLDVAAAKRKVVAQRGGPARICVDGINGSCGGRAEAREAKLRQRLPALGGLSAQALRDISSRPAAAHGEALGQKLVIREKDDGARNAKLLGEVARGGKPAARGKDSGENRLPQAEIDLPKKGFAVLRKWYREFHKKWLYEHTMERVNLIQVAALW